MSDDLRRQAQEKLAQARRLIEEAGELAKQGQFSLYFGEIGRFIPKSAFDRERYRAEATEAAAQDHTGWEDMSEDERREIVDDYIQDSMCSEIGNYEALEAHRYGEDVGDRWWHPSRC